MEINFHLYQAFFIRQEFWNVLWEKKDIKEFFCQIPNQFTEKREKTIVEWKKD
jgi:hypothetical protein